MSHTNGDYGVQAALAAGVDSLEHGNYMNEESLTMLAESDTVWVPTLVTVRNLLGDGRYDDETLKPIIESAEENIRKAFRMGIKAAPEVMRGLTELFMEKESGTKYSRLWKFWVIRMLHTAGLRKVKRKSRRNLRLLFIGDIPRGVLCERRSQNPRHTARIYAISIIKFAKQTILLGHCTRRFIFPASRSVLLRTE